MFRRSAPYLALGLAMTGCGTGQVGRLPAVSGPNPSTFALGFAVGTARVVTDATGDSSVGLNLVATFRQPGGQNATLANTPVLSGPAVFGTNPDGSANYTLAAPLPTEILADATSGGRPTEALGSLIGVFGYGFAPLNIVALSANQTVYGSQQCDGLVTPALLASASSIRYDTLNLPVALGNCLPTTNQFKWYGGPPAWPSASGYGIAAPDPTTGEYFHGYPLGFMDFSNVAPAVGQYTLNVEYADTPEGTQFAYNTAVASLTNAQALPPMPSPSLTVNADGSGTVLVTVPAGVSEAIVGIAADYCQRTTLPSEIYHYYSVVTRQSGTQALTLSNNLGPPDANGNPTHTFCTAADDAAFGSPRTHLPVIEAAGFDYPAFEASYPQSTALRPAIANAAGQADVTTSAPIVESYSFSMASKVNGARRRR